MNIRKVSFGLIGVTMIAGSIASCTNSKYVDKAKEDAVKYLNGDELLKAERFAAQQTNYDKYNGEAISYWDSLLINLKIKEAYNRGQQLIKDSLNNIHYRKEKFNVPFDTIFPENVTENSRNEYAKYTNAQDFINARNCAPDDYKMQFNNDKVGSIHYWNFITMIRKQKEAYNRGMADARIELKK